MKRVMVWVLYLVKFAETPAIHVVQEKDSSLGELR